MKRTAATSIGIALVLLVLAGSYWYWSSLGAPDLPVISRVPEFSFTTEARGTFTRASLEGHVTIADFIFTTCAGTCPMMSTAMSELQTALRDEPDVRFLSFSVDPETDTPEALAAYAKSYGAASGRWTFLTGPKQEIYDLTRRGFHLGLETEGLDAIIHSQKFVLVDANADIRAYYDSEAPDAMKQLVADARALARKRAP